MGLNIKDIIPRRESDLKEFKGKIVAVDAFNTLYQFLTTIRQPDGTPLMDNEKRITSHLSGLFYRNVNLLSEGLKLVYVFDGEPPELKHKTHEKRGEAKDKATERYEEAKQREDIDLMRRYSMQMVRLEDEMIEESKELLEAMGCCVVQAPGEGEAQAAYLNRHNRDIYASASQDYDSLLFGAKLLVQNLTLARKRKTVSGWIEIKPEVIELERVMNFLEINLDQLICLGILVGTDYNPRGIPGIGQKKALEIVKKYRQPVLIFRSVEDMISKMEQKDRFVWQDIFELFKKPKVSEEEIEFPKVNEDKIREILVERHDFSLDRVNKQIEKLREIKKKAAQKGLDGWM